jgi:CheY-like chemotaxis protein
MRFSDCPQDRDTTVLLAMEQPLAREYAAELLRSEGYNVFATSTGVFVYREGSPSRCWRALRASG